MARPLARRPTLGARGPAVRGAEGVDTVFAWTDTGGGREGGGRECGGVGFESGGCGGACGGVVVGGRGVGGGGGELWVVAFEGGVGDSGRCVGRRELDGVEDPFCRDGEDELEGGVFAGGGGGVEVFSGLERAVACLREMLDLPAVGRGPCACKDVPIFLGHGTEDEKVPLHLASEAAGLLDELKLDVTYREYQGLGHWYSGEMLRDIVSSSRADAVGVPWRSREESVQACPCLTTCYVDECSISACSRRQTSRLRIRCG